MKRHTIKTLFNPDYIGAYVLEPGKDLIITIKSVKREPVTGTDGKKEDCVVAQLVGQKPFIINATNAKTIRKILGSPYMRIGQAAEYSYILHLLKLLAMFGTLLGSENFHQNPKNRRNNQMRKLLRSNQAIWKNVSGATCRIHKRKNTAKNFVQRVRLMRLKRNRNRTTEPTQAETEETVNE